MPANQSLVRLPDEMKGLPAVGGYTFESIFRMSQVFHASGLFEDVTDAAQAFVKIQRGLELGLPPMAAMSAFDIVRKRLFVKPWVIAAKINTCGYGSYRVVEQTADCCIIHFARKVHGHGWQEYPPVSYTLAEAKAHGLVERSPHWKASPAHMLYQRCLGRGGAMYFPELLAGLEPPPDETPVTVQQRDQNIIDLFGEGNDPTMPAPQGRPATGATAAQDAAGATMPAQADERDVPARQEPTGHPERLQEDDEWRTRLFHLAADTREFLDGSQSPQLAAQTEQTCKRGLSLAENPDATSEQGEACLAALRTLGEQLSAQQRLV